MKKLIILISYLLFFGSQLTAQQYHFIEKGNLKVGIKVTVDDREVPIDSLCKGFDPITNMPIDLIVPEKSAVGLNTDSLKEVDIALILNNREPNFINQPKQSPKGFSMSASAGSTNSYTFIDKTENDTLHIEWMVGYEKLQLLDLYPANYFTDYISYTFKNVFEKYPDTVRYDWSTVAYIENLDERGLPIAPAFPYNHEGLFFVLYLTEDAMVQLKGYHDQFYKIDTDSPFDLLLYQDLQPGSYEFVAKPYKDAPESLWVSYPFTIKEPWWKTTTMQVIMGGLMLMLVSGGIFLTILTRQKRRERELRWKQQLTDAELKAIRAQLNPHFLFNALNSIQNLVTQQKNEQANTYIAKLSRLLRQVLSSSESQFQELEEELRLINLYLEIEQLRFPFSKKIEIADTVNTQTLVPVMLLQPYVENAVKHGMSGTTDGEVAIQINSDQAMLHIEIVDNGPGLSAPGNHSKGLALGNNRIHHLNNLYSNEASVEVSNRLDSSGVIVKISLPIE